MNREEFLSRLGAALNGEVPASVIQENLNYYDGYIREEAAKGRTEEEIIDEIGGYRLIAKTIIEANGGENSGGSGSSQGGFYDSQGYDQSYGQSYSDSGYSSSQDSYDSYNSYDDYGQGRNRGGFHMYDLSSGWKRFIIPVVIILVLLLIFSIIGGIFSLLSPIIGPLIVIFFLYKLFKNNR